MTQQYARVIDYLVKLGNFVLAEPTHICVYSGYVPKYNIVPVVNKYWTVGEEFPYPTLRIHKHQLLDTTLPTDIWVLRTDELRAISVPDTHIHLVGEEHRISPTSMEFPISDLNYVDLDPAHDSLCIDLERKRPRKRRGTSGNK